MIVVVVVVVMIVISFMIILTIILMNDDYMSLVLFPTYLRGHWIRLLIISCINLVITYALSILLPRIDVVFGLTGAVAGTAIVFSLPGLFYIFLYNPTDEKVMIFEDSDEGIEEPNGGGKPWKFFFTRSKMFAMLMVLVTGVLAIISMVVIIINI
eukprot:TRINITY_DN3596_c0_g1_i11.p1 TRINITY_DN3596_c0_g1~~TRINITY_DN3596_c0_g1_i11.p1  ORF type:complete len:155 (-),score=33.01 TRINITY_DN3596_c0_g1_i11:145-609(-)